MRYAERRKEVLMSTESGGSASFAQLLPGSHICGVFEEQDHQTDAVVDYLCGALSQHRKAVYIDDAACHQSIRKHILNRGFSVPDLEHSGQLTFLTPEETYLKGGKLIPDHMIRLLRNTTQEAQQEGWDALAVCGNMTELIKAGADIPTLVQYEQKLNDFFPSSRCIGFCIYKEHQTDPALLLAILRAHPWIFHNDTLFDNAYNFQSGAYDFSFSAQKELERYMKSLRRNRSMNKNAFFNPDLVTNDIVFFYRLYPERRFEYVSPSVERLLGYTPEEHYADPDLGLKVVHPDDHARLLEYIANPSEKPLVLRWVRKDGTVLIVEQHNNLLRDESGKLVAIQGIARDITDKEMLEAELEKRQREAQTLSQQFNAILQAVPDNLTLQTRDFRIVWANQGAASGLSRHVDDLIGEHCYRLWHGRETPCERCPVERTFNSGKPETEIVRTPDGRLWELRAVPVQDADSEVKFVVELGRDITRHRALEEQTQQKHYLESLGRLAGGIAHDFNNMLGVILGYGESLLTKLNIHDPLRNEVREILNAANRSAELTRQLLAFGRRQMFQTVIVNPNVLLEKMAPVLRRLLGEDINFRAYYATDLGNVEVDPAQFDQIMLNLVANAREAMPGGGELLVETKNVQLDESYAKTHADVVPGHYVMIAVTDTGHGMEESVRLRIFEPFFSTKQKGRVSGLGLSTVYGIVKQSQGYIWVYSEPGQGTTFKIYLPRVFAEANYKPSEDTSAIPNKTRAAHILLIEDEPALRKVFGKLLEAMGYTVTVAGSGEEAIGLIDHGDVRPDLVVTDVVLPGMTGAEVMRLLKARIPTLKALFMSGYTDNAVVHHGVVDPGTPFIQKPFSSRELSDKIDEILSK